MGKHKIMDYFMPVGEGGSVSTGALKYMSQALDMTRTGTLTEEHWRLFCQSKNPFNAIALHYQNFYNYWLNDIVNMSMVIPIPKDQDGIITDREFKSRLKNGFDLYFCFCADMDEVIEFLKRGKNGWEDIGQYYQNRLVYLTKKQCRKTGYYWFWAQNGDDAPRYNQSWQTSTFVKFDDIPTIAEYISLFYMGEKLNGEYIDCLGTQTLVRTDFTSDDVIDYLSCNKGASLKTDKGFVEFYAGRKEGRVTGGRKIERLLKD